MLHWRRNVALAPPKPLVNEIIVRPTEQEV